VAEGQRHSRIDSTAAEQSGQHVLASFRIVFSSAQVLSGSGSGTSQLSLARQFTFFAQQLVATVSCSVQRGTRALADPRIEHPTRVASRKWKLNMMLTALFLFMPEEDDGGREMIDRMKLN